MCNMSEGRMPKDGNIESKNRDFDGRVRGYPQYLCCEETLETLQEGLWLRQRIHAFCNRIRASGLTLIKCCPAPPATTADGIR